MTFYITDRKFGVLGTVTTITGGETPLLLTDTETDEIIAGVTILKGSVEDSASFMEPGNFILFQGEDGKSKFYTIITTDASRKDGEIEFYAEDAGLDLLNETAPAYAADRAYLAASYINMFCYDSGFEIGINEISTLSRTLSWTGESTVTERILSVATQFDAELYFSFETDGIKVTKKLINIVQQRGNDLNVELRLNNDIDDIKVSKSIMNLATALNCKGGTPEGAKEPITLQGYAYDDGRFYVDGKILKDRESVKKWSRYLSETGTGEGHIISTFSYDTTSKSELCNRAVAKLKEVSEMEVAYEVDIAILPNNVRIGDTVNIIDEVNKLYLNARILKLERSRSAGTAKATLGNYKLMESGVDITLQELADKIASLKSGDDAVVGYLTSEAVTLAADENGTVTDFSNANGIFKVIKGQEELDTSLLSFLVSSSVGCTANINSDGTYAVTAMTEDVATVTFTALYNSLYVTKTLTLSKAKKGIRGIQGIPGIPGIPGMDGITYYTWVKYATSSAGAGLNDSPTGMTYIGLAFNKTTAVESTVATDYSWSLMKGADSLSYWLVMSNYTIAKSIAGIYTPGTVTASFKSATGAAAPTAYSGRFIIADTTDGITYTNRYTSAANESSKVYTPLAGIKGLRIRGYLAGGTSVLVDEAFVAIVADGATGAPGTQGEKGDSGIIVSATTPENPETNQLWQDTSSTPNLLKRWNGTTWVIHYFYAENIVAGTLSAITANLGTVTAGLIHGGTYVGDFFDIDLQQGKFMLYNGYSGIDINGGSFRVFSKNPNTDQVSVKVTKNSIDCYLYGDLKNSLSFDQYGEELGARINGNKIITEDDITGYVRVDANTSYHKYLDGKLEIFQRVPYTIDIATAFGSIFATTGSGIVSPNYPVAFVGDYPFVQKSVETTNGNAVIFSYSAAQSLTKAQNSQLIRATAVTGATGFIHIQAVGRWK